jgi:hypothetical protein
MKFVGEVKDEDKRRQQKMIKLSFFKNYPFGTYIKKISTHFLVHGHSSWSTFSLHLVGDSKRFVKGFFKKLNHRSWTIKSDHE